MTKIKRINLTSLRKLEHAQFYREMLKLLTMYDAEKLKVADMVAELSAMIKLMDKLPGRKRKSHFTSLLVKAYACRNVRFRGLVDAVDSARNHFNTGKQEAAARLEILLDTYGNLAQKPLMTAQVGYSKLVEVAGNEYAAEVALLNLDEWFIELSARNAECEELMEQRFNQSADMPRKRIKVQRHAMDALLRRIWARIDALALLEGPGDCALFVEATNIVVNKYLLIIAQRSGKATARLQKNIANEKNTTLPLAETTEIGAEETSNDAPPVGGL